MTNLWNEIIEKIKAFAEGWPSYLALGTFLLYLFGYLSLRFHLTCLGIGTDLTVIDERYLFAGAKFLIYCFGTIPIILLIALALLMIAFPSYWLSRLIWRLSPAAFRVRINSLATNRPPGRTIWRSSPHLLAFVGIVISVLIIQLVMRQCFLLSNLLLAPSISEPSWLRSLLLDEVDWRRSLYFSGLVLATIATIVIIVRLRRHWETGSLLRFLITLLICLGAMEFLFLPVNYGVLIVDKSMPKVTSLDGEKPLEKGEDAWLVWEGNEGVTFLIRNRTECKKMLVTVPRKDIKKVEIVEYDPLLRVLFLQ